MPFDAGQRARALGYDAWRPEMVGRQPQHFAVQRSGNLRERRRIGERIAHRCATLTRDLSFPVTPAIAVGAILQVGPIQVGNVIMIRPIARRVLGWVEKQIAHRQSARTTLQGVIIIKDFRINYRTTTEIQLLPAKDH